MLFSKKALFRIAGRFGPEVHRFRLAFRYLTFEDLLSDGDPRISSSTRTQRLGGDSLAAAGFLDELFHHHVQIRVRVLLGIFVFVR